MRDEWVDLASKMILSKPDFYSGTGKKIFRGRRATFECMNGDFKEEEVGYKKAKIALLKKAYIHEESLNASSYLWDMRRETKKYGSVGFHCFNHLLKSHSGENANKYSSKMGPCIQAASLTLLPKGQCSFDFFYRTTEVIKKFPADLVFIRDYLIPRFNLDGLELTHSTFHFSNMTVSSMYVGVILPFKKNPIEFLDRVREKDPVYFRSIVRWLSGMLQVRPEEEDYAFKQSRRTGGGIRRQLTDQSRREILEYAQRHHHKSGK